MNTLIDSLLRSRAFYLVATILLTYMYWWSGLTKLLDFPATMGEMSHFGLNPPALFGALTIAVQILGSLLIIWGSRWAWLGAGALAVFTLATIPVAHRFWEMEGQVAMLEKLMVQEHVTVAGGLAVAAALAHWRRSTLPKA